MKKMANHPDQTMSSGLVEPLVKNVADDNLKDDYDMVRLSLVNVNGSTILVRCEAGTQKSTAAVDYDGYVRRAIGWHPHGLTEPQKSALAEQLKKFVLTCQDPRVVAIRKCEEDKRVSRIMSNFLMAANALLTIMSPDDAKNLLDEHIISKIYDS